MVSFIRMILPNPTMRHFVNAKGKDFQISVSFEMQTRKVFVTRDAQGREGFIVVAFENIDGKIQVHADNHTNKRCRLRNNVRQHSINNDRQNMK